MPCSPDAPASGIPHARRQRRCWGGSAILVQDRQDWGDFKRAPGPDADSAIVVFIVAAGIEALAQLFAGLEKGDPFFLDEDGIACARVAAGARRAVFYRKSAEAAQLDAVAASQRI